MEKLKTQTSPGLAQPLAQWRPQPQAARRDLAPCSQAARPQQRCAASSLSHRSLQPGDECQRRCRPVTDEGINLSRMYLISLKKSRKTSRRARLMAQRQLLYPHAAPRAGSTVLGDPRCPSPGQEHRAQGRDRPRALLVPAQRCCRRSVQRADPAHHAPDSPMEVLAGQAGCSHRAR